MKVFKHFLKLLYSYRSTLIPYLVIFLVIFASLIMSVSPDLEQLSLYEPKIVVFDHDDSALSRHLTRFLYSKNEKVEIEEDATVIGDAIFEDRISYAVSIPAGFEAAFGNSGNYADLTTYTNYSDGLNQLVDSQIESYLMTWDNFRIAYGGTVPAAEAEATLDLVDEIMSSEVEGTILSTENGGDVAIVATYLRYLNYILLALGFMTVGRAITVVEEPTLKRRDLVSGYPGRKRTMWLFISAFIVMLLIWILMALVMMLLTGFSVIGETSVRWMLLSSLTHVLSISTLVLLLTHIFPSEGTTSFLGTIIALATAFATGIFIPREIIWQPLQTAFSFLPTYWDVSNQYILEEAAYTQTIDLTSVLQNIGIMLLMALVFFSLTLILRRVREKETI